MKPRVVHYIESQGFGGAEQVLFNLLSEMDRNEWEPILVYQSYPGIVPFVERVKELDIAAISVPPIAGYKDLNGLKTLNGKLREIRPSVFHAHLVWNLKCSLGIMCAYFAGAGAIVATQHSYEEIQPRRFTARYYLKLYQKLISMFVNRYIAVSYKQAENFRKAVMSGNEKVKVVHNGIRVEDFCHKSGGNLSKSDFSKNEESLVLTVARIDKLKGHRYLLEAAAMVPEAVFLLAGDGTERADFEMLAKELKVDNRVVFLGHRDDVPELLDICDVFVLPSLLEGLPLSILEAMAASIPVIATDIPGVNEIIRNGENGLLVPPADACVLAERISLLLSDKTLAKRLAASGKERVRQEFSAKKMAANVTGIYEDLLSGKASRGRASERVKQPGGDHTTNGNRC